MPRTIGVGKAALQRAGDVDITRRPRTERPGEIVQQHALDRDLQDAVAHDIGSIRGAPVVRGWPEAVFRIGIGGQQRIRMLMRRMPASVALEAARAYAGRAAPGRRGSGRARDWSCGFRSLILTWRCFSPSDECTVTICPLPLRDIDPGRQAVLLLEFKLVRHLAGALLAHVAGILALLGRFVFLAGQVVVHPRAGGLRFLQRIDPAAAGVDPFGLRPGETAAHRSPPACSPGSGRG